MADPISPPSETVPARHYAAMFVAVGWLRGALSDVLDGDIDKDHLRRVFDATAVSAIAKSIGKEEGDLSVYPDSYLTEQEKHMIGGDNG